MSVRLVLLGLLRDQPMHGYEIKQTIEDRMGDWTSIAFGSIYHALAKLTDEGMIEKAGVEQEGNRPSRTIYQITESGQAEFTRLLRERRHISANEEDDFSVMDLKEISKMLTGTTQVLTMLLGAVAAVSLLVGGIGIMNIMLVSVTERTREIGIRLAIGALEREVLMQFLVEAVVLTGVGGTLGVGFGFLVGHVEGYAHHDCGGLGHGLEDEDARHDAMPWNVSFEEGFVDRDVLDPRDGFTRLELGDSIHQQEGIPVGQVLHDLICGEAGRGRHVGSPAGRGLG